MSQVNIEELFKKAEGWDRAFKENGYIDENNRVTIKEAFGTPDAGFLFPRLVSRILREATEPAQLVTPLLSVVRINSRTIELPAVNAIQAAEIPEGQEYPEQALAFEQQTEGKVSKKGVKVVFTEEVIADSQWDIVGLHVRAAGRAMQRLKEQIALKRFKENARVVFDNDDGAIADTTGIGFNGAVNDTLSWDDFLMMAASLHTTNHAPTDLIMHPLMWPVFLRGPRYNMVGDGWNVNVTSKAGVLNSTSPLGLNVLLSPFVGFTPAVGSTPAKSDVFMIDRNELGALLVREDMSVDDWTDQTRDIRSLKMKERYDIVTYGNGENVAVAKNVNLASSYEVQLTKAVS
jgi:HK97 family phage major capsid protein